MSRLETAMEQFSEALEKLEAAARKRVPSGGTPQRELQALRDDRSRLAHELDHVKADVVALEQVNTEVEGRLDTAIRDIRRVLGGG